VVGTTEHERGVALHRLIRPLLCTLVLVSWEVLSGTLVDTGVCKLTKSLDKEFVKANIKVGRDTLFQVLRKYNMLTLRRKTSAKTTNSYHRFYKYNNIIKDLEVTRPNQVWVSDITYIRTVKGFCYLALITDMHSRKIVGYDISDSLELKGCVRALNKAIYQAKNINGLIHHSDRGIQYCSNVYTQKKKDRH
jgi:putative transposase